MRTPQEQHDLRRALDAKQAAEARDGFDEAAIAAAQAGIYDTVPVPGVEKPLTRSEKKDRKREAMKDE